MLSTLVRQLLMLAGRGKVAFPSDYLLDGRIEIQASGAPRFTVELNTECGLTTIEVREVKI
jgi:hypothetical protein